MQRGWDLSVADMIMFSPQIVAILRHWREAIDDGKKRIRVCGFVSSRQKIGPGKALQTNVIRRQSTGTEYKAGSRWWNIILGIIQEIRSFSYIMRDQHFPCHCIRITGV